MQCTCIGKVASRFKPSTEVGLASHCRSSHTEARPGGISKLDPGHGQLKGSASIASAYLKPAADHGTGVMQQDNDSSAVACGHAPAACNGVLGGEQQCLSLIKVGPQHRRSPVYSNAQLQSQYRQLSAISAGMSLCRMSCCQAGMQTR